MLHSIKSDTMSNNIILKCAGYTYLKILGVRRTRKMSKNAKGKFKQQRQMLG